MKRKISAKYNGAIASNSLLRKQIGKLQQKQRIIELHLTNMKPKYVCDDCEEIFESSHDPRHQNYINEWVCICETCNDKRVYNLYG